MKLSIVIISLLFSSYSLAQPCNEKSNEQTLNEITDDQYIDLENGATVDQFTALMWQTCSAGQSYSKENDMIMCSSQATTYNWLEAFEFANNSQIAGFNDWRLPNIKELASIEALNCYDPAIDESAFPNTVSAAYWSATMQANINRIWILNFTEGTIYSTDKTDSQYLRLVRDL